MVELDPLGIVGRRYSRMAYWSPFWLTVEARHEGRREFIYLGEEKKEIAIIPTQVAQHFVTKASKEGKKWEKGVQGVEKEEKKLGETQIFLYYHFVGITEKYNRALRHFIEIALQKNPDYNEFKRRVAAVARTVLKNMVQAMIDAKKWGGQDVRTLMAIMNEAMNNKAGDFVGNFRTLLKKRGGISLLGRFSLRMDIKKQFRDYKALKALSKQLEAISAELEAQKGIEKSEEKMLGKFESIVTQGEHYLYDLFLTAHVVMKRNLINTLILLSDEKVMIEYCEKWRKDIQMPAQEEEREISQVQRLEKKLSNDAHLLANGLGVIVKKEIGAEREMEQALALAA